MLSDVVLNINDSSKKVTGKVTSDDGIPLPGVNIRVKNSQIGVSTDAKGPYSIQTNTQDMLLFSSVGYLSQEVKVGNRSEINTTLVSGVSSLDEVVVIGYGTQRKASLTGAVASVSSKELLALPVPSIESALQGKIKTTKIYFSIDLDLSAWHIVWFYGLRFQIEFIYRDGNQFTGLENSQARSEEKLYFHFNTALTTVSLAKSEYYLSLPKEKRKSFSMANVKTLCHNELLINRFFSVLGIDPNTHLNNPKIKELYHFGSIAA